MPLIRDYYQEMLKLSSSLIDEIDETFDYYLCLRGPITFQPEPLFSDLLKIRTKSEWIKRAYVLKKIDYFNFNTFQKNLCVYEFFRYINIDNDKIKEAIQRDKKIYFTLNEIILTIKSGGSLSDFVSMPDDVINYVNAQVLFDEQEYQKSLELVQKAIELNSYCDFYDLYFKLLIKTKDTDLQKFETYLSMYKSGYYQHIINNETLFHWLKMLLKEKYTDEVLRFITVLRHEIHNEFDKSKFYYGAIHKFDKNIDLIYNSAMKKKRKEP